MTIKLPDHIASRHDVALRLGEHLALDWIFDIHDAAKTAAAIRGNLLSFTHHLHFFKLWSDEFLNLNYKICVSPLRQCPLNSIMAFVLANSILLRLLWVWRSLRSVAFRLLSLDRKDAFFSHCRLECSLHLFVHVLNLIHRRRPLSCACISIEKCTIPGNNFVIERALARIGVNVEGSHLNLWFVFRALTSRTLVLTKQIRPIHQ